MIKMLILVAFLGAMAYVLNVNIDTGSVKIVKPAKTFELNVSK